MKSDVDIYSQTYSTAFSELFAQPPSLFRGAPFWSWNNKLDPAQLCRQIEMFKTMGIGGFHMHSRVGLNTPYLGDDFMAAVAACVEKAKSESMIAWLYDEDRWPSGAAGGLVTRDERYRSRQLLFCPKPPGNAGGVSKEAAVDTDAETDSVARLLGRYAVRLSDGFLANYRRLKEGETAGPGEAIWYAYVQTAQPSSWFNNQTYLDTLNPEAVARFVEVTHERYREVVGSDFGTVIPGIFTDEPNFTAKSSLSSSKEQRGLTLPFTDDFPQTFQDTYGSDILDALPELVWELPGGTASVARYRYHDHVAERFAHAFADTVGAWCEANGIALTGHLLCEESLASQTRVIGDAMRSYRSFQLPGIDMLCDQHQFTTAKQAQSASRQYGRNGVLSELYGVTGWDFDFAGHKCQGDWQAALGVTVRVHHLSWVSMAGEAKRDYPASILYQSPWWQQYPVIEDHFARVNVALTRGRPHARVGVIHPVESYWLCYGPADKTSVEREDREYTFDRVTEWLLFGLVDYDYICESLLPELNPGQSGKTFQVGAMAYDSVVVPPMKTIRASTLERLEAFADDGGHLIFSGEVPSLVDAVPSQRPAELAARVRKIAFSRANLLTELDGVRELDVITARGDRADRLAYQIRVDGDARYVFLCNTSRHTGPGRTTVRLRGRWDVDALDTGTGGVQRIAASLSGDWTELQWICQPHGHLLLRLEPCSGSSPTADAAKDSAKSVGIEESTVCIPDGPVPVTLSEPNALLLDQPEWRLGDGQWQPREEILRLDDRVRDSLGLPRRGGSMAQPWTEPEDPRVLASLDLKFVIDCDSAVTSPLLAIEQPESLTLRVDGKEVDVEDTGWWVDEAIRTLRLPDLAVGRHELVISVAYRRKSNIEWCYLLGDFGVKLAGRNARIVAPVRQLAFDDLTRQGLPFYTGNVTYHCSLQTDAMDDLAVRIPHFTGAMIGVRLDGETCSGIAFAPFETGIGTVEPGEHRLDLTLYGNRQNAFGPLHWTRPEAWVGPGAWRTNGDEWCYEYCLKPLGITAAPRIRKLTDSA